MALQMFTSASTCSLEPLVHSIEFKSGAVYTGTLGCGKKSGNGTFRWPSGVQYTGEYLEDRRHGYGVQVWAEGSNYEGEFRDDLRHGKGRHTWMSGEVYEGEYVADKKHGWGTYAWRSGAHFSGNFEFDRREGRGVFLSADGEKFEGKYCGDIRDGEGVMSYPGGRQDVGVWRGEWLIQLKYVVHEATFDPTSPHPLQSGNGLDSPDLKSRGKFGPRGPLEMASEELIQAASLGSAAKVASILRAGGVQVEVVDRNGHSALFAAAIHSHPAVINILLDNGADVNRLDSMGISVLTASHHLLYAPFPRVQDFLKLLPSSIQSHAQSSSPATEYTLHTSDFLSTPPNTPYFLPVTNDSKSAPFPSDIDVHMHIDFEKCTKSLCNTTKSAGNLTVVHTNRPHSSEGRASRRSNKEGELSKVRSYPLLPARAEKKVRFISTGALLPSDTKPAPGNDSKLLTEVSSVGDVESNCTKRDTEAQKTSSGISAIGSDSNEMRRFFLPAIQYSEPTPTVSVTKANAEPQRPPSRGDNITQANAEPQRPPSRGDNINKSPLVSSPLSMFSVSPSQEFSDNSAPNSNHLFGVTGGQSDSSSREESPSPMNGVRDSYTCESDQSEKGEVDEKICNGTPRDSPPIFQRVEPRFSSQLRSSAHTNGTPVSGSSLKLPDPGKLGPGDRGQLSPLAGKKKPTPLAALLKSELHSSSVFSSTRYGPIVSAAQSTTLSCGESEQLEGLSGESSTPSPSPLDDSRATPHSLESSIALLLQRGADPNASSHPLPPLTYAIRAGDLRAVERLLQRGASTRHRLLKELGGLTPLHAAVTFPCVQSAAIVELLLEYGADPNSEEGTVEGEVVRPRPKDSTCEDSEGSSTERNRQKASEESCCSSCDGEVVAGEHEGLSGFTPLHLACSLSGDDNDTRMLSQVVLAVLEALLSHGAEANRVARGHSPLSLTILSGHDEAVEMLLEHGADPNLPLGGAVGSALCALTSHTALRKRDYRATLALLRMLLQSGADVLLPVRVKEQWKPGTVVDFAHEAFKQDKRLALVQYNALTKMERTRYKAAKKLIQHLVNLLRCKALENISKDHEANCSFPLPHTGPTSGALQGRKQLHRTMSATETHPVLRRTRRNAQSAAAGAGRPKGAAFPLLPISLPEHTLRTALEEVARTHRRNQDGDGRYFPSSLEWTKCGTKGLLDFDQDLLLRKLPGNPRGTGGVGTGEICSTANPARQNGFSEHSHDDPPLQRNRHWTLLSFCYKCGRSTGVRLLWCPGCRAVCYCSQSCRAESWMKGHQHECTGAQVNHEHSLSKKHRANASSRAGKIVRQQQNSDKTARRREHLQIKTS